MFYSPLTSHRSGAPSEKRRNVPVNQLLVRGKNVARATLRFVRWHTYRLLAPARHRAARDKVRALPPVSTVLVVCYGNVCRSPYLEAILRTRLPRARVYSAGFVGPGRTVPQESLTVAAARGTDLGNHLSQLLTPDLVRAADLVLVMDTAQEKALTKRYRIARARVVQVGDLDPQLDTGRTIADPWGRPDEAFETCFTRLDRCADVLVLDLAVAVAQ